MEQLNQTYNQKFAAALRGRRVLENSLPQAFRGKPMFSFWGEDAGVDAGDVHCHRAYRIYLDYDENRVITDVEVVVEGDLISPCSGYRLEALDEFDFEPVLRWCLMHTEEGK